jgi:hypothetical protein
MPPKIYLNGIQLKFIATKEKAMNILVDSAGLSRQNAYLREL